jgi:hypothetical protein
MDDTSAGVYCPDCGCYWTGAHTCPSPYTEPYTEPLFTVYPTHDSRMADALERIAKALERIEAKL